MKTKLFSLLLTAALLFALGGCGLSTTAAQLDAAETRIEQRLAAVPETALTEEEAVAIALEHAGLTQDQISGLRVQYEVDDRVPEYEIEFRQGRVEYDYTIHAETGDVLFFEKGD